MAIKEGWAGRYYEDFEVGDVYRHRLGRTVTATDNIWFTLLTQNSNPVHFDHATAAKTAFGRPIVVSTLTLALVTGQSVSDISLNSMTNLGWDEVRLPNPLFEGETVYSQSEVLEQHAAATIAGVIEQQVESAESVFCFRKKLSHGGRIGDVRRYDEHLSIGLLHFKRGRFQALQASAGKNQ